MAKIGVLLINLGTPDAPTRSAVYRYLKQFLLDRRVIDYSWLPRNLLVRGLIAPFRSGSSAKLYQKVWTNEGSPIKIYGFKVTDGLREILGPDYVVELAMRYQNPSIESAIEKLEAQHVDKVIVFPLFPQYASATIGSIHDEVMRIYRTKDVIPEMSFINSYYDHPELVSIFAENAKEYNLEEYNHFLFSFHGLPQRQLKKGDSSKSHCLVENNCCQQICEKNKFCYSAQCHATAHAIAKKLKIDDSKFTVCFQSRLGPEAWAQPYTSATIKEKLSEGNKKMLVFSPAFVADCLETIIEIGYEYKEEFIEMGGEKLDLVKSLNDNPRWIKMVALLVQDQVK
jgi:ferrochelatase